MFLKTLQIKGFKSFADGATLDLEPGVTVVVGPNGSGKSNVVDAVGWVLGAQAPSAVRSQKMDDVIFAGSAKRPALGRAEVSLTIDNSAGLLPIDFSEVTISRTLFRSGDSDYSINGVSCRLLDIQELLSDSGVGRQQHVIISQGQIDAVLNARPEDRRLIIEEAAGILKFRKRKEKAERRLLATEANLTRIQDMLREVRRQLKPLERQADAARRHADVVAELNALRIHLAGRELARLRAALQDSTAHQADQRSAERQLRSRLAALDAEIIEVEARLSGAGGNDVSDVLVRYESFWERGRGLAAVIAERRRGVERDREAFVDQAVVASLEVERAECVSALESLDGQREAQSAAVAELREAESELRAAIERFEADRSDDGPEDGSDLGAVRAEVAAARSAAGRSRAEGERLASQRAVLVDRIARRSATADEAARRAGELQAGIAELEAVEMRARSGLEAARAARESAEASHEAASADAHRWGARAEALALALDEARQRAGAERLVGVEGVLGTLLDSIEIDDGWEAAVEAAASDILASVVVSSPDAARAALQTLADGGLCGSVLPIGAASIAPIDPADGEPVRRHVRGLRDGIDALLDSVLANSVRVDGDWRDALDVVLRRPELTVVTPDGDRFSARGWALRTGGAGATGAALDEARSQAARAAAEAEESEQRLTEARRRLEAAEHGSVESIRTLESARAEFAAQNERRDQARSELDDLDEQRRVSDQRIAELEAEIAADDRRLADLEARLPALEEAEAARQERLGDIAATRRQLDERARAVQEQRSRVDVATAQLDQREQSLRRRIEHLEERLKRHQDDRVVAQRRHRELDARSTVLEQLGVYLARRLDAIEGVLGSLRAARQAQFERTRAVTSRLESLRRDRSAAERELEAVRERLQRAEIADAETRLRLETATESLRGELDCEPEVALAAPCPPLPEGTTAVARARELERDLRLMGPINPLALEEFQALQERNSFFEGQLDDIRQTRRELSKVIRAVDEEIVNVFTAAYADVSENFVLLFDTLFPGGHGQLRLTEPHDLLQTGIEIEARPSGKNVKKLSLLSGGERSLTALAYLFAVFRSRPSPFYVMDEVEAALDDVNLHRFLGLIAEFRETAQLIIVSHQKRTMEAADVLYGVTMEPGGSSKVLSERVAAVLD